MTIEDQVIGALCAWRENSGGGVQGMQSVFNVLVNRATERNTSVYEEAVRKDQFSSMTTPGDPCLIKFPTALDPQWAEATTIASQAAAGQLDDITKGANLYYNPKTIKAGATFTLPDNTVINFPIKWNPAKVKYLTSIAGHVFFKE
jgi:spore germination cell wall hydrolase CwlJ-like protein